MANEIGTFCVVLGKRLAVSACPLPKGACFWKHRIIRQCKYSEAATELEPPELAILVGLPVPSESQFLKTKEALLIALRAELSK